MESRKVLVLGLACASLLAFPLRAFAADISLHIVPEVAVPAPVEGGAVPDFSTGLGLALRTDLELSSFSEAFVEGGLVLSPLYRVDGKSLLIGNGGLGLGLFTYPIPRLKIRVSGGGGAYSGRLADLGFTIGWYWRAGAEAGYRLSPGASLLGSAGYQSFQIGQTLEPLLNGFTFGLALDLTLSGSSSSGLKMETLAADPIYPVNYAAYGTKSFGKVAISNLEPAELRDVKVSFLAGPYSAEAATCVSIPLVPRGGQIEVPLFAILNPTVLGLSENTKIQGEVKIEYELLGKEMTATKAEPVVFVHRNALIWADPLILGCFVSPNDPAVLDLSKFLAGLIREKLRPDIDKSLQFGMGIFESLRLLGLKYAPDPSTPYASFHREPKSVDYLQYPYQSLAYKGGDSDDLSVLYAAFLESVGLEAAFAIVDSELLVAFPLQMPDSQARSSFNNPGELIFREGKAWVPIQVSRIREGFLLAWQGGARLWNEAVLSSKPEFVELSSAWKKYAPVGLPGIDYCSPKPDEAQVNLAFENAMSRFVAREVDPRAQRLLAEMGSKGSGRQYNNLGILYAKYGLLKEATDAFLKATNLGYGPAYTNLANVAFLLKDYETAVKYFEAALALQPDNKTALIGLARAKYEIDAYADADELYSKVSVLDPALAKRYAYLSSKVDVSSARASAAAADRGGATTWDEGE